MIFLSIISNVQDGIADFFRKFCWSLIESLMNMIDFSINALINGVLGKEFLANAWIKEAFSASLVLMAMILPAKLIYEIFFGILKDDEKEMDITKKLFGALTAMALAVSLSVVVPLANTVSVNVAKALIGQEYTNIDGSNGKSITSRSTTSNKDLSKALIVNAFVTFGGMPKHNTVFSYCTTKDGKGKMDLGAERFYEYVKNPDSALEGYPDGMAEAIFGSFMSEEQMKEAEKKGANFTRASDDFFSKGSGRWGFYYRFKTDSELFASGTTSWDLLGKYAGDTTVAPLSEEETLVDKTNPTEKQAKKAYAYILKHAGEYAWDFSELGVIVGLSIFCILILVVAVNVAIRVIMITFLYVIGPICCTALTNYSNPQAFTIWKNSIVGMWLVNTCQIFMLQFMMNIASDISAVSDQNNVWGPIASLALYFGALGAVIQCPAYIQSMIGGYGQGIMETLNSIKGSVGGLWGMSGGLVMGAGRTIVGRHNDNTGHMTGGIRGKIMGNKGADGRTVGGVKNIGKGIKEGVFGRKSDSLSSKGNRNDGSVRNGGFFGRDGTAHSVVKAGRAIADFPNHPMESIKNMGATLSDVVGMKGSGPSNWARGKESRDR